MFDVIGKRNWFFAFSLLITIPGLIFLLMGPFTGGKVGLQFAIDFTGGTVWTIRFADENVTPAQVQEVMTGQGFGSSVTKTGDGFIEIRTKEAALSAPAAVIAPVPSAAPSASPDASASPAASAGASASRQRASASPGASASPAASRVRRHPRRRHPVPSRAATCRRPASWARCALRWNRSSARSSSSSR